MADHRKPTESFMGSIEPVRPGSPEECQQRIADLEQRHKRDLEIIQSHLVTNGQLQKQIQHLENLIIRIATHGRD